MVQHHDKALQQTCLAEADETQTRCESLVDGIRFKKFKRWNYKFSELPAEENMRSTNGGPCRATQVDDETVLIDSQSASHSVYINQVECLKRLVVDQGAELMELKHKYSSI